MDIQKAFGCAIRSFRNERGISQEQFSLTIGMDRTYYSSVENGKRNISIKNIEKISKGLGVSLVDVFLAMENCITMSEEGKQNV